MDEIVKHLIAELRSNVKMIDTATAKTSIQEATVMNVWKNVTKIVDTDMVMVNNFEIVEIKEKVLLKYSNKPKNYFVCDRER